MRFERDKACWGRPQTRQAYCELLDWRLRHGKSGAESEKWALLFLEWTKGFLSGLVLALEKSAWRHLGPFELFDEVSWCSDAATAITNCAQKIAAATAASGTGWPGDGMRWDVSSVEGREGT